MESVESKRKMLEARQQEQSEAGTEYQRSYGVPSAAPTIFDRILMIEVLDVLHVVEQIGMINDMGIAKEPGSKSCLDLSAKYNCGVKYFHFLRFTQGIFVVVSITRPSCISLLLRTV